MGTGVYVGGKCGAKAILWEVLPDTETVLTLKGRLSCGHLAWASRCQKVHYFCFAQELQGPMRQGRHFKMVSVRCGCRGVIPRMQLLSARGLM